jgi:hypothetical protein
LLALAIKPHYQYKEFINDAWQFFSVSLVLGGEQHLFQVADSN